MALLLAVFRFDCWVAMLQLDAVAKDIHRHHDLIMVLRKYREQPDFADLIDYTQVTKLPADVSISGFPMILRTAFEGFAFCFSRNLYIRPEKKTDDAKGSKRPEGTGKLRLFVILLVLLRLFCESSSWEWRIAWPLSPPSPPCVLADGPSSWFVALAIRA